MIHLLKVPVALSLLLLTPTLSIADNYDVNVTRKGSNLYKIDGKNIYIHTRYCYEYAYYERSILAMDGYYGKIIFTDSGQKCDVKAVYSQIEQQTGKYHITVTRDSDDWYEVAGQDVYIKTSLCLSLALGEDAFLIIPQGGIPVMYVSDNKCVVEGVYSSIKL